MDSYRKLIYIAGGTGCGKTKLAWEIQGRLGDARCLVLAEDWYYYPSSLSGRIDLLPGNFDHPKAIDFRWLVGNIKGLLQGNSVSVPVYHKRTHMRRPYKQIINPADVIIVEGLFVLWEESLKGLSALKVFLNVDADIRLTRRLLKDVGDYGVDLEHACRYYLEIIRPNYNYFIQPTIESADIVFDNPYDINQLAEEIVNMVNP